MCERERERIEVGWCLLLELEIFCVFSVGIGLTVVFSSIGIVVGSVRRRFCEAWILGEKGGVSLIESGS